MRTSTRAWLAVAVSLTSLAMIGAAGAIPAARAAAGPAPAAGTAYSIDGVLNGIAAVSPDDVWAVGQSGSAHTMILHWNGRNWSQVTNPKPLPGQLLAVTAVAADNVWAVGQFTAANGATAQVMHWNGKTWRVDASRPAAAMGTLAAAAGAGTHVWAVGGTGGTSAQPLLIRLGPANHLHVVPTAMPPGDFLSCVAVTGPHSAWAAGSTIDNTLMMRWNGTGWKSVSIPLHGASNLFFGMAAGPAGRVWLVGNNYADQKATSMLWNGKAWRVVPVPVSGDAQLLGVSAIPGGTDWAVGDLSSGLLMVHWSGKAWTQVKLPAVANAQLNAVTAESASDAWAVGYYIASTSGPVYRTVILHWNGKAWS